MKNILLLLTLIFVSVSLQAQEEYIFNQYFMNQATINPGASGFNGDHNVLFNYRNTWSGFDNAPKTFMGHYNGEVANKVGLGATLVSDQYANLSTIRGGVSFAYMIKADNYKIGAGISTQYQQYRISNVNLNDELVNANDTELLQRLNDAQFFEASIGMHGELKNGLFFDLAFPGIVRSRINEASANEESPGKFNYFFGAGYPFKIMNYDMVLEPSIYIKKFRNVPLHIDFNALMKFLDGKLLSGVTYSNGADNRLGFLIGTQINTLRFNYSYNISFHDSQEFNNGGHEIGLGLILDGKKQQTVEVEEN